MEQPRNRLLAALPSEVFSEIRRNLEHIELEFKRVLIEDGERVDHVTFVESGVVSVIMQTDADVIVEVATIGREGFVGTPVLLAADQASATSLCQIPGNGYRMSAADFRDALGAFPAFQRLMLRYTQALISLIARGSTCNRVHNIEERAARWLLMTHDRVDGDSFPLTQEFLAQMLGVRRQAVNIAAGMLQQAGMITYSRGAITILDRAALESASCDCYRNIQQDFDRLIGGT